ncbi:c-type cytochrome [Fibrella sp. WM1]|uniref:c-type cytochrome n=1 Tax=Fibrella musci TaxID=3242485 RepID=UPI0035228A64
MSKAVWLSTTLTLGLCGWITPPHKPSHLAQVRLVTDSLPARFGFGKPASSTHIAQLSTAIRPDGQGLPAGSGTATTGATLFAAKCAACHGPGGVGGPNGSLVTTNSTAGKRPEKTIGNYWPYATTVFDYIRRAMPFNQPGSLTDKEVYALTAYLLHANGLIDEKTELNARTLPTVTMPAQPRFVPDDRRGGPEIH